MPPYTAFPRSARNLGRGCSLVKPAIQRRDAKRRASTTLHRPPQGEHPSSGGQQGVRQPPFKVALSELHSYSHMKTQFYARNWIIRRFSSDLRRYLCFLVCPRESMGQRINNQGFRWAVLERVLPPRRLRH